MSHRKGILLDLLFILLLGLIPLTWFVPNHFILSVDSNLPFTLERWVNEVFFSWDTHLKAGWSPRMIESTHFFFFIQWLFQFLGMSLLATQRAIFVFWFCLPGFTLYFLMRYLFRDFTPLYRRIACFTAIAFYMFNLFLEPVWIGFSVSNLLAYAFIPLLLRIWIQALEEKRNPFHVGFLLGVLSLMASGIATNPANVFVSLIPFFILTFFYLFRTIRARKGFLHLVLLVFFTGTFVILFNLYWILTELHKVFDAAITTTQAAGKGFIVENWLRGISSHTSFFNVIRMLGNWTLYAEPRPYALALLKNPFFVLLSWLVPLFGFAGLFFKTRYRLFIASLLGIGLLLSMGVHFPMGKIYLFLVEHLPYFWLVRSPWYKFTMLTCLGYAFFMGVAAVKLYQWGQLRFSQEKWRRAFSIGLGLWVILFPMVYAYPVTFGKMFLKPQESTYPNHFQVPDYVRSAGDHFNQKPDTFRLWTIPGKGFFMNTWGFSGFTSSIAYFTQKPLIYTDHNLSIPISNKWMSMISHPMHILQNSFEKQLTPNLYRILGLFHADTLLAEKDFRWKALPIPYSLEEMQDSLSHLRGIELTETFGDWDLYKIQDPQPYLYFANSVTYVEDNIDALVPLSNTSFLNRGALFFAGEVQPKEKQLLFYQNKPNQIVLHDKTWFDLAVDFVEPFSIRTFSFEPGGKSILNQQIQVKEKGSYLIFAKRGKKLLLTQPRSLVDDHSLPQEEPIHWDQRLRNGENWITVNGKLLEPSASFLYQNINEGKKWVLLGEQTLESGMAQLSLKGESPQDGEIQVKIASKVEVNRGFKLAQELFEDPDQNVSFMVATEPSWNHGRWAEADPNQIEKNKFLNWQMEGEFKKPFSFQGSTKWHSIKSGEVALRVMNKSDKPIVSRLAFQVLSVQPRLMEIYVYQNEKKVKTLPVPNLVEKGIALRLKFEPGENRLSFRASGGPIPLNRFFKEQDNSRAIFLLKNIQIGDQLFQSNILIPKRDEWTLRIYPFKDEKDKDVEFSQPKGRFAKLDKTKIPLVLKANEAGGRYWESEKIKGLAPGAHILQFKEIEGKRYFVEFSFNSKVGISSLEEQIQFEKKNPTLYEGTLQTEKEGWLVFSESFDSRWVLKVGDKALRPVKVNGYANAYWVPSTSAEKVPFRLEFAPQQWMSRGLRYSAASFSGVSLLWFISLFFSRRKKDSSS